MTLTPDEIIRIVKISRYKAYREKMGYKDEPWSKYLESIDEETKETEQEGGNE